MIKKLTLLHFLRLQRVAICADFEIFMIDGGTGDIYNSTSTPNYRDEPYADLGMYVNKVLSTWTEVSTAT